MHPCSSDVCLLQFAIESYLFRNLNEKQDFSCDKAHTNIVLNVMQKTLENREPNQNKRIGKVSSQLLHEPRHEKTAFCICENKDADQLRGNREADQRLCFRYPDSTIPLLPKSEISCL